MINIINKIKLDFEKNNKYFIKYLKNVHFGEINTYILKNIYININNKKYNIFELSNINLINKITLKITPYNIKNLNIIKKELLKTNIGKNNTIMNIKNDIIIKFSLFTEEKRKLLIKEIKNEFEKIKISLRNIRNKYNNYINKKLNISDDDKINIKKKIQDIYNENINNIKKEYLYKEKEILKI
ncbi:MAG: hypothetical protein RDO_1170 [Flavobacteriales endosymbiont of Rhyzopertha dominica]|nr:MAG: ribosome-recycling factor [Candidatus Shikimatogenerans bostrichidophilus]